MAAEAADTAEIDAAWRAPEKSAPGRIRWLEGGHDDVVAVLGQVAEQVLGGPIGGSPQAGYRVASTERCCRTGNRNRKPS
jgi:hypothetical protein